MRTLVSVFEIAETTNQTSFERAWARFDAALTAASPETRLSPILKRVKSSGYDTDRERHHSFLTTITFPDAHEADRVWNIMEDGTSPLNKAHVAMLRLTRDQFFTFWKDD